MIETTEYSPCDQGIMILDYIDKLCCIDMLRNFTLGGASLQLAYEYGQEYQTPWRDTPNLIKQFWLHNQDDLKKYVTKRALRVVRKLLDGKKLFATSEYHLVPMEANVVNSIRVNLDKAIKERKIFELLDSEYKFSKNYAQNSIVRPSPINYAELEALDTLLVGHFDTFKLMRDRLGYNDYSNLGKLSSDFLAVDGSVYQCFKCLEEIYDQQIENINPELDNFKAWARIFSILYRFVVPKFLTPDNLTGLYKNEVLEMHRICDRGLEFARTYSSLKPEDVLDTKLPKLSPKYLGEFTTDYGFKIQAGSLTEKYLALEYQLDCIRNGIKNSADTD